MARDLFCGEALCKASVALSSGPEPWPVRCGQCGTALYPGDVLARLPPNELEPKRGELMTERGGRRVPIASGDLAPPARPAARARDRDDDDRDADRLLAMIDLPGAEPARRKSPTLLIAVAIALVLLALGATLAMR